MTLERCFQKRALGVLGFPARTAPGRLRPGSEARTGDDAVTTLALSGADNTGTTKQLGILTRRIGPAAASSGPLDAHDARWEAIKKNGMSRWWFETGTMQEVAEVLATSYLQRILLPRPHHAMELRRQDSFRRLLPHLPLPSRPLVAAAP
ncbi:hypothetical protein Srufu_014640 [Streptomyces libani subsp. rufus]|nr:hypothetical protein Srufu_014640 [Streptomyces libani subsp. rufus]